MMSTSLNDSVCSKAAPVVVAITGASGGILAFKLVYELLTSGYPVELILTEKGFQVTLEETGVKLGGGSSEDKATRLLHHLDLPLETYLPLLQVFGNHQLDASPASGTHLTAGMVIIPCSMGTLGRIAAGIGDNLTSRAADVTLKEGRKLILAVREAPLSAIHLENMLKLARLGVCVLPPMLTFYLPEYARSMEGQLSYTVGKVLDQLRIPHTLFTRWSTERDSNPLVPKPAPQGLPL
ncbi:MAG: UbiX family flavin prenyltransferase [Vampirovibrionales bacterium]